MIGKTGHSALSRRGGFTLTEVVVSSAIFALLAAGIASTTMLTSQIANDNIYENTAFVVAQGYAEQIKSIRYDRLKAAFDNPVENNIPTESVSYGSGEGSENDEGEGSLSKDDPLIFGIPNEKEIVIDVEETEDGKSRERVMRMWITPEATDLSSATNCYDSMEIVLAFEWESFDGKKMSIKDGAVRIVKTNVSEY